MRLRDIYKIILFYLLLLVPFISFGINKTDYENIIILTSDGVLEQDQIRVLDPNRNFLRERIGLDDEEIDQFIKDEENYYLTQFGLDFTKVPWENSVKTIPGVAIMEIRTASDKINFRAHFINDGRDNYPVEEGGIFVNVIGEDVVYHGLFGGEEGKPAFPLDEIASGFYRINRGNNHKPQILHFRQSTAPTRLTFEGWKMFIHDIKSPVFGEGKSDGLATIQPDNESGNFRSVIRNVISFPGRLPDSEVENNGVSFLDIAADTTTGITYRRVKSFRDNLLDDLKSQPIFTLSDMRKVPIKSRGAPGVAILDYDRDGDLDLYITNGPGRDNALYANQFAETGQLTFVDTANASGVSATNMDGSGVCYGDIDNDFDHDLYVLGSGEANRLFENQGDGTFTDITEIAGMGAGVHYPSGCAMGDVNGDGLLDIVVANTVTSWDDRSYIFEPFALNDHNQLFINKGSNLFDDASNASGIRELAGFPSGVAGSAGVTWAIALVDYDLDGDVDIVMADDQARFGVPSAADGGVDRGIIHVMSNDGTGKFTDVSLEVNTNRPGNWMGLAFGDINTDGYLDMFLTNLGDYVVTQIAPYELGSSASRLFLGQADGSFSEPGVGGLVASGFGWGTVMTDYDNDGDTDIVYHGGTDAGPFIEASNPGLVLANDGDGKFSYDIIALANSTNHSHRSVQGFAAGDLNNDGFEDLVSVSNLNIPEISPLQHYQAQWDSVTDETAYFFPTFSPISQTEFVWNGVEPNDGTLSVEINSADNGNNHAVIDLLGTVGLMSNGAVNLDGIGSMVSFTPDGGKTVMKPVLGGASYGSQSSLTIDLGMGKVAKGTVEVLWPGGVRNRLYGLRASERLIFPEIPCSFDDQSLNFRQYRECVISSLKELKSAGLINEKQIQRFSQSAKQAYLEYRM